MGISPEITSLSSLSLSLSRYISKWPVGLQLGECTSGGCSHIVRPVYMSLELEPSHTTDAKVCFDVPIQQTESVPNESSSMHPTSKLVGIST